MKDQEYWEKILNDLSPFEMTSLIDAMAQSPDIVQSLLESSRREWCDPGKKAVMRMMMKENVKLMQLKRGLFQDE